MPAQREFRERYLRGREARLSGDLRTASSVLLGAVRTLAAVEVDVASKAMLLIEIGLVFKYWGKPDKALPWYRAAESILGGPGAPHPLVPDIEHNIGGALHAMGEAAAAEPHARRAVALRREFHGHDLDSIASDEVALAAVLVSLGERAEALALLTGARHHFERTGRESCEENASALHNLAAIEAGWGRLREAEDLQARCLAIRETIHGAGSPYTLTALANLGRIRLLAGHRAAARAAFEQAMAILDTAVAADHPVRERVAQGLATAGG